MTISGILVLSKIRLLQLSVLNGPRDSLISKYILALTMGLVCSTAQAQTFQTAFSPHQGGTTLITQTIDGATKSIHLAAYGFTSVPIIGTLCAAVKRGVVVEAVVDESQVKGKQPAAAKTCGVSVRFNSKYAIMHDKFIIVDGATTELGSFNFTHAAEANNAENILVVHDAGLASVYEVQWQKLWGESQ